MRRCGVSCGRRWRAVVWCAVCLLALTCLLLRDAFPYLLPSPADRRTRRCPPSPVDPDVCESWRPLPITHKTCGCTRDLLVLYDSCSGMNGHDMASFMTYTREYYGNSTCSDEATVRGPRQHVVSLSWSSHPPGSIYHLNRTVSQILDVYKGWVVRVYTRLTPRTRPGLCKLMCGSPDVDLCDVTRLPKPVLGITDKGWPGWRWGVVGDPLVAAWAVRGTRQVVLAREAHALTQFINSDKCWHLLVDHPSHAGDPLGSHLLGGKTSWGGRQVQNLRRRLLQEVASQDDVDRLLLEELLPMMGEDVMTHDSLTCTTTPGALAFPSPRPPGCWVGMPRDTSGQSPSIAPSSPVPEWHFEGEREVRGASKNGVAVQEGGGEKEKISNISLPVEFKLIIPDGEKGAGNEQLGQKQRAGEEKMSRQQEWSVNDAAGIPVCPRVCRPHMHKDWDYC